MTPDTAPIPDTLRRVQTDAMQTVLGAWFEDAREQWRKAVCLLAADDPDIQRVREAFRERVVLDHLMSAYWALCERYAAEVFRAPQPDMFGGDYETRLQQQWLRFAIDYMRGWHPLAMRMVLQATVGLAGHRDRHAAGTALVDYIRDNSLMGW